MPSPPPPIRNTLVVLAHDFLPEDRVKLSAAGRKVRRRHHDRLGTVKSVWAGEGYIRVLWDGRRSQEAIGVELVEGVEG